jgi:nicotinate-nucleotide adenylyltransferase
MADEAGRGGLVVFGGTFDPPHLGHLILACDAREALGPARFLVIPCGSPPHRPEPPGAPADLRLEMVRAMFADHPEFEVDDREIRRPGPSYTVATLRELALAGSARPTLLMGEDQYRSIESWSESAEVRRLAEIAVLTRSLPGAENGGAEPGHPADGVKRVAERRVDISSSEIRARVEAGRPVGHLVTRRVEAIIAREGLYRSAVGIRPGLSG